VNWLRRVVSSLFRWPLSRQSSVAGAISQPVLDLVSHSLNEPVPPERQVFRLLKADLGPLDFQLSSTDKAQDPPLLSVWDIEEASPDQSVALTETAGRYTGYVLLSVAQVKSIQVSSQGDTSSLNVVYDPIPEFENRPGGMGGRGYSSLPRRATFVLSPNYTGRTLADSRPHPYL
jgi:hypothetical protein